MPYAIVFATYDIKTEAWNDFAQTATIEGTDIRPIVLVYSYSPQNVQSVTNFLAAPVKTELSSASYPELRALFRSIVDAHLHERRLSLGLFLILDEQSATDRQVVIVHREPEWVHAETGERLPCHPSEDGREDQDRFEAKTVWRRFRVPFEEALSQWLAMQAKGSYDLEEHEELRHYLQRVDHGPAEEREPFQPKD
ncbi:MAG: hypothetical protein Q9157_001819 [Trypethelium eluteriae]